MEQNRRWYDKDPVLSKAMKILETTDDQVQLKVAINLIKIIIEHNIEADSYSSVEDILGAVKEGRCEKGSERWYDLDKTLKTSIQMLENCPEEMQCSIAKNIADLIRKKFRNIHEEQDFEAEEI